MLRIVPIVLGCLIIIFHKELSNYYRSFGPQKISPVRWIFTEEVTIIMGIFLILTGVLSLFHK